MPVLPRHHGDTARPLAILATDADGLPRPLEGKALRLRALSAFGEVLLDRAATATELDHPELGVVWAATYDLTIADWAAIPVGDHVLLLTVGEGDEAETYPLRTGELIFRVYGAARPPVPGRRRGGELAALRARSTRTHAAGGPLRIPEADWGPFPDVEGLALAFAASRRTRYRETAEGLLVDAALAEAGPRVAEVELSVADLDVTPGLWDWELIATGGEPEAPTLLELTRGTLRILPALGPPPA